MWMKRWLRMIPLLACMILLSACSIGGEYAKIRDLPFTVLGEEVIPEELKTVLEEKKAEPFQLTFSDKGILYICEGYGTQKTGGYSIAVDKMYLSDHAIVVQTTLLGPEPGEKPKAGQSWPYIVLKTEDLEKCVVFE